MSYIRKRKVFCSKICRQWVMNHRQRRPCIRCGSICYPQGHNRCKECFHKESKEQAKRNFKKRFLGYIQKTPTCWLWTGAVNNHGYGNFNVNHKTTLSTRISYELHIGKIPEGLWVLHHCDNPPCVKPAHLYAGTPSDNIQDAYRRNRIHHKKKISDTQVQWIRSNFDWKRGTLKHLAKKFSVSYSLISSIVKNQRRVDPLLEANNFDLRRAERL